MNKKWHDASSMNALSPKLPKLNALSPKFVTEIRLHEIPKFCQLIAMSPKFPPQRNAKLRKLVRQMLVYYDRYGVIGAFAWLAVCIAAIAGTFIPIEMFLLNFLQISPQLSSFVSMFLISPLVIFVLPTLWATGFLINERLWMFLGIYQIFGWEHHRFRKMIGRLAGEER